MGVAGIITLGCFFSSLIVVGHFRSVPSAIGNCGRVYLGWGVCELNSETFDLLCLEGVFGRIFARSRNWILPWGFGKISELFSFGRSFFFLFSFARIWIFSFFFILKWLSLSLFLKGGFIRIGVWWCGVLLRKISVMVIEYWVEHFRQFFILFLRNNVGFSSF